MKQLFSIVLIFLICHAVTAQEESVFQLMERRDLTLQQIEQLANKRFEKTGTGQGTGYKHFQRWLHEMRYHVDANGNFLPPDHDWKAYQQATTTMQTVAQTNLLVTGNWKELKPTNWAEVTGGHAGTGRLVSLAIHPSDTTVIYAASPVGGIWKSSNSGGAWQPLTDDNGLMIKALSVAIAPSNKNILYAGMDGTGVIISTNAGINWSLAGTGVTGKIKKILIHPQNPQIVFACSVPQGIFRSDNGGATWTKVHDQSKEDIAFKPGNPDIMYASGDGNAAAGISPVWKSTDNGLTWTAITPAQGIQIDGRTKIAVTPANPDIVYALQAHEEGFARLYRSVNSGNSFTTMVSANTPPGKNYFSYDIDPPPTDVSGIAHHAMGLCVNPTNSSEVHISSVNVWRSVNSGQSFDIKTDWGQSYSVAGGYGYCHADVSCLEWVGKTLYAATDGGIYKSRDNGSSWTDLSANLGIALFYQISTSKTDSSVYVGASQDNGTMVHKPNGWRVFVGGDGVECIVSHADKNVIWVSSQFGFMSRTDNGGLGATPLQRPSPGNFLIPMVQHPTNAATIFTGLTGVYKSTNSGTDWTKISGNTITAKVKLLEIAPSNPNYLYASTGSSLFVTKNGGSTWTIVNSSVNFEDIAVSPTNPEKIWVACNGGGTGIGSNARVLVSTNGGISFTDITANLPDLFPRSITVDNNADESVYVGMNIGIYYADKFRPNWIDITDNLPKAGVQDIEIHQATSTLRVSAFGRGIWQMPVLIPPCGTPVGLKISSVTFNSARLTWNAVPGAASYTVQYKGLSDLLPLNATASQNAYDMINLRPGEFYTVKVRANCNGQSGIFSTEENFITLPNPCTAPANLSASPSFFAATLSWGAVSNAQYYEIRYRKNSETNFTVISNITATNYTLVPLAMNTGYFAQVWAFCSQGNPVFSSTSFTTLPFNPFGRMAPAITAEKENAPRLKIAPNPVRNRLLVTAFPEDAVQMEITDIHGRLLKRLALREWTTGIDVSFLRPGMYWLRAMGRKQIQQASFIKE